jgi:hypothetical protein
MTHEVTAGAATLLGASRGAALQAGWVAVLAVAVVLAGLVGWRRLRRLRRWRAPRPVADGPTTDSAQLASGRPAVTAWQRVVRAAAVVPLVVLLYVGLWSYLGRTREAAVQTAVAALICVAVSVAQVVVLRRRAQRVDHGRC